MLTPAGQLLTLQEAARRVQGGLSAWKGLADKPELLQEALRLIDECKTCAVAPETLFAAAEESEDAVLAEKLSDLAQILTAYERLCEESLPDPRDRLTHLRDRLAESHTLDGAAVYLDGFLGFTVQESAVVDAMLAAGVPLSAAVTCDTDYPEIFLTGCKTVQKLTRMAKHHNQTVERIELGESKVARPAGLAALERESLLPVRTPQESADGVRLYEAASPFDECEHAAAYIRRKVRDEGARCRDFVVAARDIEPYSAFLAMAMARYDIPVFLAEKPDLLSRPPMALVTGALEGGAQSTSGYEGAVRLLSRPVSRVWSGTKSTGSRTTSSRGRSAARAWERDWVEHPDGYGLSTRRRTRRHSLRELNDTPQTGHRAVLPHCASALAG